MPSADPPLRAVLLTGGRAPVTLELARVFSRAGVRVHVAESARVPLTRLSRHARHHRVPPPRQQPHAFVEALVDLVATHAVDLVIPTCEETFWVALGRDRLPVPVPDRTVLRAVHHKGAFVDRARQHGLAVPETVTVTDADALRAAVDALGPAVVKPAFSRFATRVFVAPTAADLATIHPTPTAPWVVQEQLPGPERCSWSLAHQGRLLAHADYRPVFTANRAAVAFTHEDHPRIRSWVEAFVAAEGWSGQIAFDWREGPDGPVPIECNPRSTSGIHLLADVPGFAHAWRAFLDDAPTAAPPLTPEVGTAAQVGLAMLLYGRFGLPRGHTRAWWRTLRAARDVLWAPDDPLPLLLGMATYTDIGLVALREGVGLLEASTVDIRWDGEEDGTEPPADR